MGGRVTGGRVGRRDTQGQASGAGSVDRVGGARGDVGVRARGAHLVRLERWVQVMNSGATDVPDPHVTGTCLCLQGQTSTTSSYSYMLYIT
jgi:hypothetical protein